MAKPIIQIRIEGPAESGNSKLALLIADTLGILKGYTVKSPASSYDPDDSYQLEDSFHIIQIKTKKTP